MNCENCKSLAYCNLQYKMSEGMQSINLCYGCADEWFNKYKHTDVAQSLVISDPRIKK